MSQSPEPALRDAKRWGLPLIIFTIAIALRLMGIGWGLPNSKHQQSYHPDEPVVWAYSQGIQPAKLKFTPGFYNYGTLYLTTLKIASDVVAGYSGGGLDHQNPDKAWEFIGKAHLAGRIISALAGAGTALIVFLMLRRFSTDFGAFCGGLLIAFAPANVVHSRFQTVDILAAFLIAVSAFFALKLIPQDGVTEKRSDLKLALLSGLFAGLSAGTKYTGILCLLTLFVVIFGTRGKAGLRLALSGLGVAILAFVITTPGILLESKIFLDGFLYETAHVKTGHGLIFEGTSNGFLYHFANLMLGVGLILSLLGLAGLFRAGFKKHWWAIGLLAFFIPYYILIAGAEVKFIRYTFPLFIGLGVGFGWLMGRARELGGKWHSIVGFGLLGLGGLMGGGLQSAVKFTAWMASLDPRDAAGEYLRGKSGSVGLVADPWFYTPAIHPRLGRRLVYLAGMHQVGIGGFGTFARDVAEMSDPAVVRYTPTEGIDSRLDWDDRLLTEAKPDFVVYSSFESEGLDRIAQLKDASPVGKATADRARAFMKKLNEDYDFDRQFGPIEDYIHDLMYVQPRVMVWKRKAGR